MSNSQSLESQTQKCFIRVLREEFCSSNTHSKSRKQKAREFVLNLDRGGAFGGHSHLCFVIPLTLWNSEVNT